MTKLKRESLSDRVYDQLRAAILSGQLRPSRRLLPADIAEEYGVSLIPVREAIRSLEAEGLVELESNRAIHVRALSPAELNQVLAVRKTLEGMAVQDAMKQVTDGELDRLQEIVAKMEGISDRSEWLSANKELHFHIYRLSGNEVLIDLITQLWIRMEPYLRIYEAKLEDTSSPHTEHARLVDALAAGDVATALEVQEAHVESAGEIVKAVLEKEN